MTQSIQLSISDNNLHAAIMELIPGCTEEAVRAALELEGITTGIRWDAIVQAVKNVNESGMIQRNIPVVSLENQFFSIRYGTSGPVVSGEAIPEMKRDLADIGTAIITGNCLRPIEKGAFVRANETALTITFNTSPVNIYGHKITAPEKNDILKKGSCIALKTIPDGYNLVALVSGYLIINKLDEFDIADPFLASDDKQYLYCYIIPLIYGHEALIDKIRSIQSSPGSNAILTSGDLDDISKNGCMEKIELRRGKLPVQGRPGSIRFLVTIDRAPKGNHDDKIDYREFGFFKEVTEGTVLAERIPMRQSEPGVNVYGDTIDISKVNDIVFSCGNGVDEEYSPDLIRYIAKIDGILEINDNFLNVVPELVINGDVDNSTGNIKYSRSVLVQGNIAAGFKVECGSLKVRDSIEDFVEVVCNGDLYVSKGILGEHTKISVSGNAIVGLVQSATLRVQGNCTVNDYAYHANIFCTKKLTINGNGITTREKGCIIGGTISSLSSMDLHSVGSVATLTTLCCGFDPEGLSILTQTINLEKTLKKKILQLQNKLRFVSTYKEALIQKIQNYSQENRDSLKTTLLELRQTISQVEKTDASIACLSRKVFTPNIVKSQIYIHNHIIAPTLVEFPKLKRKIYRESAGVRFAIVDGEIVMYEGLHGNGDASSDPT